VQALGRSGWPWALAGLYAVALGCRLAFLQGPLLGEEAAFYSVARHWGADPTNVFPPYQLNEALWWQRPVASIAMAPGAAFGVTGLRLEHALVASLIPVFVAVAARRAGTRPGLAVAAGLALALFPALVLWGARASPGPWSAVLALAGLLALQGRRPVVAAGLLLCAAWTHEAAIPLVAAAFVRAVWQGRRAGLVRLWPLELDRASTALLAALLAAPLPFAYAQVVLQGRGVSIASASAWDDTGALVPSPWLLAPLLGGLLFATARPWAILALAAIGTPLAMSSLVLGHDPSFSLPLALVVLASVVTVSAAARHAAPAVRRAGVAAGAVAAVALLTVALIPSSFGARDWAGPADATPPLSELDTALAGDGLDKVLPHILDDQWDLVLLVDVAWPHVEEPFARRAETLGWSYTGLGQPPEVWSYAVENSQVTVLAKTDRPVNESLRRTYADCVQYEDAAYVLLDGPRCPGRTEALRDEIAARQA
jgi:hypothetical protein